MAKRLSADAIAETICHRSAALERWVRQRGGGASEIVAIAEGVLLNCWVNNYKAAADAQLLAILTQHIPHSLAQLRSDDD